jgi:hypothetical protein
MKKIINETMYDKLVKLGIIHQDGSLKFDEYLKLKSRHFMDLNIDHLSHKDDDRSIVISLAHNYNQNGDVILSPHHMFVKLESYQFSA